MNNAPEQKNGIVMMAITLEKNLNRSRLESRLWRSVGVPILAAMMTACDGDDTLAGDVTGYNHMPDSGWSIAGFTINGAGGPNIQPESGGGAFSCCMSFPKHWHPGMKAKVRWFYNHKASDPEAEPPPPQEAEVEIPEYTPKTAGAVNVHFYPDHRIKVVISRYSIEHPRYPMSEEDKKPWVTRTDFVE